MLDMFPQFFYSIVNEILRNKKERHRRNLYIVYKTALASTGQPLFYAKLQWLVGEDHCFSHLVLDVQVQISYKIQH